MKRAATILVLAMALGSCATPPPPAPPPPSPRPAAPPPVYTPPPPPPPRDQCGAASLQDLIGKPRTEIPVPVNPGQRRVACTTCPMTMEFRPDRVNILYDADTGIVREVRCG